jgi:hypothetical protein
VKHVDDSVVGARALEVLLEERVDARLEDLPRAARRSAPRALSAPTAPVAGGLWVQPFGCRAPGPAGRTRPSLIAFCFTSAFLYQHGCPRRVMESSMMSSSTRKHACSHSMHHPTTYRPPAGPLRPAPPCPPAQRAPAPRRQPGRAYVASSRARAPRQAKPASTAPRGPARVRSTWPAPRGRTGSEYRLHLRLEDLLVCGCLACSAIPKCSAPGETLAAQTRQKQASTIAKPRR